MIQARCLPQVHLVSISYIARSAVLITSTVTLPPSQSPLKYHEPPGRCARGGAPSPEEKLLHTWVHPITLATQGFHVSSPDFSIWEEGHRGHATCSPAVPRGLTAGWGLAWPPVTHQGGLVQAAWPPRGTVWLSALLWNQVLVKMLSGDGVEKREEEKWFCH